MNGTNGTASYDHGDRFKPAKRITSDTNDVWSMVNAAAAASPIQPMANLGQGFFGYNPPQFIIDAHKESVDRVDVNQYSPTKGRPNFKNALAQTYSPLLAHEIDPVTEVAVTTGANEGMLSIIAAFVEPGEEIIVLEPFFDQYILSIELMGAVPKPVPMRPPKNAGHEKVLASDWTLDMDALSNAVGPKTKGIILNSPHNPLGKIFNRQELEAIAAICVKHSILVLSDEVYDRLYYAPFVRMATLNPQIAALTFTIGSLGKTFYATGWRIGYVIGPPGLITHVAEAHKRICYTSPGPPQEAGAVAFAEAEKRGFWDEARTEMKAKMDRLNQVWDEIGLPYSDPQGGYFVLVNTRKIKIPDGYAFPPDIQGRSRDFKLSFFLIKEIGVAAIPPTDFYSPGNAYLAEDYLRFAVCKNDDLLDLAKERLRGLRKYME